MAKALLTSTVSSTTVKRSHVEQIIKAWNGANETDASPLVLNHSVSSTASAPTPLKIIVNTSNLTAGSATKALHVVDQSNNDVFYVTVGGTVFPNLATSFVGGTALLPILKFYASATPVTGMYGDVSSVNITVNSQRTFGSENISGTNFNIFDAGITSSSTMVSDFEAIVLKYLQPSASTSVSGGTGVQHIFRTYSYDTTLHTRDYIFRAKSKTTGLATADGYLELFDKYLGNETSIVKFNSSGAIEFNSTGLITGKFAPDKDWPPTTATPSTETATTTTFPQGAIPVYQVVQSGAGPSYTFSGTWQQLAAGANGYILVADNTVSNGIKWAENSGGGFVRSFLLMGG